MTPRYRSWIPTSASARVRKRYPSGRPDTLEYFEGRKLVGTRCLFESGEPEDETPYANGRRHGTHYVWLVPGVLLSAEPWRNGLQHGTARQWDADGRLIGTYTLTRGTGWDLWRQPAHRRLDAPRLSEAIRYRDGQPAGFEWWINDNQRSVWIEQHWRAGQWHGIRREWNGAGRLSHGTRSTSSSGPASTSESTFGR
jgi:hypothetical protein